MNRVVVTLNNPTGLHARPATLVVKESGRFKSRITIKKGDKISDSKRIMEVLALDAQKGDRIEIIAEGPDENEALEAMKRLIENNFNE